MHMKAAIRKFYAANARRMGMLGQLEFSQHRLSRWLRSPTIIVAIDSLTSPRYH